MIRYGSSIVFFGLNSGSLRGRKTLRPYGKTGLVHG